MLCNVCGKNEARVHLSQIAEGKTTRVDLCEFCAKEKGIDDASLVSDSINKIQGKKTTTLSPTGSEPTLRCSVCGYTQADLKKTGRLGCAHCYKSFEEKLKKILKSMHPEVSHVGKTPEKIKARKIPQKLEARSLQLQEQLKRAVKREQFEEAAILRDELKAVREEIRKLSLPPSPDDETD